MSAPLRVVIVGGGFGGLNCAQQLRRAPVDITLVDRRNFHLFQPLLYQVATGGLSPANIAAPLRFILKRHRRCRVLLGEVIGIEPEARELILANGRLPYDALVVAPGSTRTYFGHAEWQKHAPGLKTIEDAMEMRRRILGALESAESEDDGERRMALMTFVVIGGGPTGVELAGALTEITRHTMHDEFRRIAPESARIVLVESGAHLLPSFAPTLSTRAQSDLERLGVEIRCGTSVTAIDDLGVDLSGPNGVQRIPAATVLWGAGVAASPLCHAIAEATRSTIDRNGRLVVEPDCTLPGHPEIFVIGDAAHYELDGTPDHRMLPGLAQVAMQQGAYVAAVITARGTGHAVAPFRYRDFGTLATIGKHLAVGEIAGWKLRGGLAWLVWVFVHILQLVGFQNRLLVLLQWAWYWASWGRSARLITGVSTHGNAAVGTKCEEVGRP